MIIIIYIMIILTIVYTAYMQMKILSMQDNKDIVESIILTNKRIDLLETKREAGKEWETKSMTKK